MRERKDRKKNRGKTREKGDTFERKLEDKNGKKVEAREKGWIRETEKRKEERNGR